MEWIGRDAWKRTSVTFSMIENAGGSYVLRRIVNRDGSTAAWFDKGWLTYRGGGPVAVGEEVSAR